MSLIELECKRAERPADRPRNRLADEQGTHLQVTTAGGKYWRLKFRHGGKEKLLALRTVLSICSSGTPRPKVLSKFVTTFFARHNMAKEENVHDKGVKSNDSGWKA